MITALSLSKHRQYWSLVASLARREVAARYKGSLFGNLWAVLTPTLMLVVYTFVFSEVLGMRWPQAGQGKTEFALALFCGLVFFNLFSETVVRAPSTILANPGFVSKVVFPLEALCIVNLLAALFNFLVGLTILIVALLVIGKPLGPEILGLLIVLVPFCLFTLGVAWVLAALGVYVRDLPQVTGLVISALMFLAPIFYPLTMVPEKYRWLINLNPLTIPIDVGRQVLMFGRSVEPGSMIVYSVFAGVIATGGFLVFRRLRSGFADVI